MKAMSKYQIADYLKNYAIINAIGLSLPTIKYRDICNMEDENYYSRMVKTYESYLLFKSFSILEDYALNKDDLINNNDLKDIRSGSTIMDMPSNLSDKRVIQLVRNAFNHNDSDEVERFKISEDAEEYEVYFKDIRTPKEIKSGQPVKPVNFKFTKGYLYKLALTIQDFCRNKFLSTYEVEPTFNINSDDLYHELDKVKIIINHLEGKQPEDVVDLMTAVLRGNFSSSDDVTEYKTKLDEYLNQNASINKYPLTHEQKLKIIELRDLYKHEHRFQITNDNIGFFLLESTPIPMYKQGMVSTQLIISTLEESNNMCFDKLVDILYRAHSKTPLPDGASKEDKDIYHELTRREHSEDICLDACVRLLNNETSGLFPIVMYLDYVMTNIYKEEYITINNVTYERDKIRNSFAHLRWFITSNQELMMYDASPRNKDVYNLVEIGNIPIDEFFNVIQDYVDEKEKRKNK